MKIVEMLIQGSKEWHDYRGPRYGASDHAAVMSGKRTSIIKDKVYGRNDGSNQYSLWGQSREPEIREIVGDIYKIYAGAEVVESANPRVYASLDGFCNLVKHILEIKTCKFVGQKLLDKIQEWAYQMSHQFYCVGDESYKMFLAVERYSVVRKNGKEMPDEAVELTLYQVCIPQEDRTRMMFIPIKRVPNEDPETKAEEPFVLIYDTENTVYANILTKEQWEAHAIEFLHQLDIEFQNSKVDREDNTINSIEDDELDSLIHRYNSVVGDMFLLKEQADIFKEKIEEKMSEKKTDIYQNSLGNKVAISYKAKPMTEKFIRSKIDAEILSQPEYQTTVLDIDKVVKEFALVADKTKTVKIS